MSNAQEPRALDSHASLRFGCFGVPHIYTNAFVIQASKSERRGGVALDPYASVAQNCLFWDPAFLKLYICNAKQTNRSDALESRPSPQTAEPNRFFYSSMASRISHVVSASA